MSALDTTTPTFAMLALTLANVTTYHDNTPVHMARCMREYWTAKSAGDKSAALVPYNPAPSPALAIEATPASVSIAANSGRADDTIVPCDDSADDDDPIEPANVAYGVVSDVARDRVIADHAYMEAAGFRGAKGAILTTDQDETTGLLYAAGRRVNSTGDANLIRYKRDIQALPNIHGAAKELSAMIAAEERRDIAVNAIDLRINPGDGYTLDGVDGGAVLNGDSFAQLCEHVKQGPGATYLSKLKAERRARNVNEHLTELQKPRPLILRTRIKATGGREVYAAVTPSYTRLDADTILSAVAATGTLDDARVEMHYENAKMRATALHMPDRVVNLSTGDVFKAGVRISTQDGGKGRIKVSAVLFRNRCENLIIIDEATVETMSKVHRGEMPIEDVVAAICTAVAAAYDKIEPFLARWGEARAFKVRDPKEALAALVSDRNLTLTGMRSQAQRGELIEALGRAFDAEPGDSAADLANAITRAAHERTDLFSLDLREELEKQASALILLPGQLLSEYAIPA